MNIRCLVAVTFMAICVGPSEGQKFTRELTTSAPDKTIPAPPYLFPVVAPTANLLVINDALDMMFIAHRPPEAKDMPKPNTVWPQLAYARIDAKGVPGAFKSIALPKPATFAKQSNYPLAVAFHPKLPLLYVWQDIQPITPRAETTDAPVYKEFDHVLIYHLDGAEPELLMSFGKGSRFAFGLDFACMTLDPAATRLFVGNLQHAAPKGSVNGAVGYFKLAADGLPDFDADPRAQQPIEPAASPPPRSCPGRRPRTVV